VPLLQRDVKDALLKKFGFQEIQRKRSKHDGLTFYHEGRRVATTWFSRASGRTIQDEILKQMAEQVGVYTLNFFKGMITCSKSLDDYVQRLRERDII
jgi:hypothetical protein